MTDDTTLPTGDFRPTLICGLAGFAVLSCIVLALSIFVADFVVPHHDWIADTISDLGAGDYEYIVDIGLYTFSGGLIALALLAAHVHLGGWDWSGGLVLLVGKALLWNGDRRRFLLALGHRAQPGGPPGRGPPTGPAPALRLSSPGTSSHWLRPARLNRRR